MRREDCMGKRTEEEKIGKGRGEKGGWEGEEERRGGEQKKRRV